MPPRNIPIDANIEDADWLRGIRWDLPTSLGPFLTAVQVPPDGPIADRRAKLAAFMRLPAARAMPPALRRSLVGAGLLRE